MVRRDIAPQRKTIRPALQGELAAVLRQFDVSGGVYSLGCALAGAVDTGKGAVLVLKGFALWLWCCAGATFGASNSGHYGVPDVLPSGAMGTVSVCRKRRLLPVPLLGSAYVDYRGKFP